MSDTEPAADRDVERGVEEVDEPSPETEEAQEKSDEAMGKARDAIARAEATLHDQLLAPKGGEDIEDEDHLNRADTRGAFPNWVQQ